MWNQVWGFDHIRWHCGFAIESFVVDDVRAAVEHAPGAVWIRETEEAESSRPAHLVQFDETLADVAVRLEVSSKAGRGGALTQSPDKQFAVGQR